MKVKFMLFLKSFTLLLCLGAIVLPVRLLAQCPLEFGATAALDFDMLTDDGKTNGRTGFSVQGVSSLAFNQRFSLQAGLGYAYKPYRFHWDSVVFPSDIDPLLGVNTQSSIKASGSYHELQLPVLFKVHLQSIERGIYVGVGPMLSLAMGFKGSGIIHLGNGTVEVINNIPNGVEFRPALQSCAGYRFALTPGTDLGVEVYGNAYAYKFFFAPARIYSLGARVGVWL